MAKAYSTIGTILKFGAGTGSSVTTAQICPIKSFPALGGAPDQIESTDLENTMQTFVAGVQSIDTMEFTANYTKAIYTAAKANDGTEGTFELVFGQEQGTAKWTGMYHIHVTEGEVNGLLEMQIVVSPSSDITIE